MEELNMKLILAGEKELTGLKKQRESANFKEMSDSKRSKIEKRIKRLELALTIENPFHEYQYSISDFQNPRILVLSGLE